MKKSEILNYLETKIAQCDIQMKNLSKQATKDWDKYFILFGQLLMAYEIFDMLDNDEPID